VVCFLDASDEGEINLRTRGRGFVSKYDSRQGEGRYSGRAGRFEVITEGKAHAQKCKYPLF